MSLAETQLVHVAALQVSRRNLSGAAPSALLAETRLAHLSTAELCAALVEFLSRPSTFLAETTLVYEATRQVPHRDMSGAESRMPLAETRLALSFLGKGFLVRSSMSVAETMLVYEATWQVLRRNLSSAESEVSLAETHLGLSSFYSWLGLAPLAETILVHEAAWQDLYSAALAKTHLDHYAF